MSNEVFPTTPDWGIVKRPVWATISQVGASGLDKGISLWFNPVWEFDLVFSLLQNKSLNDEFKPLIAFFNKRRGRADTFLFDAKLPDDYQDLAEYPDGYMVKGQHIGVGTGEPMTLQLIRAIEDWLEPCKNIKPLPTPKIYADEVLLSTPDDYIIDAIGQVSCSPALGAVVTADFSFYYRVKFTVDSADFEYFAYRLWKTGKITLRSVK